MSSLPHTTHDTTTRRTDTRQRAEAATYTKIVAAIEAQQRRMEAARQLTAEFLATLGIDADGDQIFA